MYRFGKYGIRFFYSMSCHHRDYLEQKRLVFHFPDHTRGPPHEVSLAEQRKSEIRSSNFLFSTLEVLLACTLQISLLVSSTQLLLCQQLVLVMTSAHTQHCQLLFYTYHYMNIYI